MNSSSALVKSRELTVDYGTVRAVNSVDFDAFAGEVVCILGPNGAGKTTTVETLEGYRRPTGGTVRVCDLDPQRHRRAVAAQMGVMLQSGGVYPMLTPKQAVSLFAAYFDQPLNPGELLDRVGLSAVAGTRFRRLSGGEQRRLALALALVGRPRVLFLDEPTAGVDPEGRTRIREVITEQRAAGVCVVLTTHELHEAELVADRIVIIQGGKVLRTGTLSELRSSVTTGVRFTSAPGIDTAAAAVALGAPVVEERRGNYRIDGETSPALTGALVAWLTDQGLPLIDLRTIASLEEAYFDLTEGNQ